MAADYLCYLVVLMAPCLHGYPHNLDLTFVEEDITDEITCWTCPNKTDNEECNNWAPDITCPTNHTMCKTVHRLHAGSAESLRVHKMCVPQHDCTEDLIGCFETELSGVMDCVSCCSASYCNELVPTNISTAVSLSSFRRKSTPSSGSGLSGVSAALCLPLVATLLLLATDRHLEILNQSITRDMEFVDNSTDHTNKSESPCPSPAKYVPGFWYHILDWRGRSLTQEAN